MRDEILDDLMRRARTALAIGASIVLLSTLTYYGAGCVVGMNARYGKSLLDTADDRWEWTECLYAAGITVTAVGYTDLLGTDTCEIWSDADGRHRWISHTDGHEDAGFDESTAALMRNWSPWLRVMTLLQSVTGMAFFLFVIAQATSFFVEGGHGRLMWALRTTRLLRRLRDHVVVCGAGEAATQAVDRLAAVGVPCAVVEADAEAIRRMRERHPNVPCVLGDANEESVLHDVRVEEARAVLALLPDDPRNLVSIVSVRELAPDVRITSRGVQRFSERRLSAAGADAVLRVDELVGVVAASQLCRPGVVGFLQPILRGEEDLHLSSLTVGAALDGHSLGEADLRHRSGLTAIAHRPAGRSAFSYNPGADEVLRDGDELVVLGPEPAIERAAAALTSLDAATARPPGAFPPPELQLDGSPYDSLERVDHYIVCGMGYVGAAAARELAASGRKLVLIDSSAAQADELRALYGAHRLVVGDAQDPAVLEAAGIMKARGLIAALPSDQLDLVVSVTARSMRSDMRVVVVARERRAVRRLEHVGAEVISLGRVGGLRAAAEVLSPQVATFIDRMRRENVPHRFEGVVVREGRPLAGRRLRDAPIYNQTGLRVIAMRPPGTERFIANPGPDEVLRTGTLVVVIGTPPQVRALGELVGDWE